MTLISTLGSVEESSSKYRHEYHFHSDSQCIFSCHKLEYKHMNKDIYLIEAPKKFDPPRQWVKISGTSVSVIFGDHLFIWLTYNDPGGGALS